MSNPISYADKINLLEEIIKYRSKLENDPNFAVRTSYFPNTLSILREILEDVSHLEDLKY